MIDLWPDDISQTTQIAPVTILKAQATYLGRKTQNLVEGSVMPEQRDWNTSGDFRYQFDIDASTLKYTYRLLTISHSVDFYPVKIEVPEDIKSELRIGANQHLIARDEQEFNTTLMAIFNSQKARRIISALLSQMDRPSLASDSMSEEELPF